MICYKKMFVLTLFINLFIFDPTLHFNIIPIAYAQPSWTSFESLKADENGVFRIIGVGEGPKLSEAKEAAYENINFQIEGYLQHAIKEVLRGKIPEKAVQDEKVGLLIDNVSKLALNLIKNLEVAETYFDEREDHTFKYYVLYQLSEKQLEESIRLYSYIFAK